MRFFVAVELPAETRAALGRAQDGLRDAATDVSWTSPESWHVTLQFLGEAEPDRRPAIAAALSAAAAGVRHFEICCRRLGTFGGSRARILWASVDDPSGRLADLQRRIEAGLRPLGFSGEGRDFRPHVTLGRVRRGARSLSVPQPLPDFQAPAFLVGEVVLFQSLLLPMGARHIALDRAGLSTMP